MNTGAIYYRVEGKTKSFLIWTLFGMASLPVWGRCNLVSLTWCYPSNLPGWGRSKVPLRWVTESRVVEVGGGGGWLWEVQVPAPAELDTRCTSSFLSYLLLQAGSALGSLQIELGFAQSRPGNCTAPQLCYPKGERVFCTANLSLCCCSGCLLCFIVPPHSAVQSLAPSSQGAAARSLQSYFFSTFCKIPSLGCASQCWCSRTVQNCVSLLILPPFLRCFIGCIIYFSPEIVLYFQHPTDTCTSL